MHIPYVPDISQHGVYPTEIRIHQKTHTQHPYKNWNQLKSLSTVRQIMGCGNENERITTRDEEQKPEEIKHKTSQDH